MADWGAEVVKIESPDGDPIRLFFDSIGADMGANPVFELDNRGKRAITLDLAKPAGREVLLKLLAEADVFLTNLRPGALKRAGIDYEALSAAHPCLIYASVTGYGLEGPDADRAGFDTAAFWSRAGVAALTTPKGMEPFPIRTAMGDHICSLATCSAILAAVVERSRTGRGRLVETSLIRAGVYAVGSDMAIAARFGRVASNRPRKEAVSPLANFFQTREGRWLCLIPRQGSGDWPKVARAAGRPDLLEDERFISAKARRTHTAALVEALDEGFGALDFAEAARRLDLEDVAWAPVQTAQEVLADPQAAAAGCFVQTPDGQGGAFRAPAAPARFPGADDGPKGPAPRVDQHTDEVLAELGYPPAAIAQLRAEGVVGARLSKAG